MSGEDVYDLAVSSWCYLCDAPHPPCELPDLRYLCLGCTAPIEDGEEVMLNEYHYHAACARVASRRRDRLGRST